MAYTLVNGSTVYPAQVSYQLITLTANIVLSWPSSFGGGPIAAGFNDVNPDQNGWTIILPDATLASNGTDVIFNNVSLYTFNVLKNDSTLLLAVAPGQIVDFKLYDSSTAAGLWRIIPFGGGYNGIVAFQAESSDNSIVITDGDVVPPGAIIDFKLPTSLFNLNNVGFTGLAVITDTNPLTWVTAEIIAGANITVVDGDGVLGNPTIALNPIVTGLDSLSTDALYVGGLTLLDSVISSIIPNGGIVIDTTEAGGDIVINDSAFDVDGNLTVANNLTVTGSFNNPFTPKAWCIFTDISNIIVIESQSNVSSIVNNSDGIYEIFFTTPMSDINYGVLISLGSTGGSFPFVSHGFWTTRNTSSVVISIVDASGELVSSVPYGATIMIMST